MKLCLRMLVGALLGLVVVSPGRAWAAVPAETGYVQVATGSSHTLALTADGRVLAWGWNLVGQLGDGTITDRTRPVGVVGLPAGDPVVQIAAGNVFSMALTQSGKLFTWGSNSSGELGIGSFTDRHTPVQVTSWRTGVSATGTRDTQNGGTLGTLPPITQIAAGLSDGYAVGADGYAYAWGNTSMGAVGVGVDAFNDVNNQTRHLPRRMETALRTPLTAVAEVTAGDGIALVRTIDQKVWFAGEDTLGTAGQGEYDQLQGRRNFLVKVSALDAKDIVDVEAGLTSLYARTSVGQVYSWGDYTEGELCRTPSGPADLSTPTLVSGLTGVATVTGGRRAVLFTGGDGTVRGCGSTSRGTLTVAQGAGINTPTVIPALEGARWLDLSDRFGVGIAPDGSMISWGYNEYGQLGDDTATVLSLPRKVEGVTGATRVIAGVDNSYAIVAGGQVRAWGANKYGALGIGTTTPMATPTLVPGLSGVVQVSTGMPNPTEGSLNPDPDTANQHHVLALTSGGDVYGWGANHYHQLGDGTTTDRTSPVPIDVPGTVVQVAAGGTHSLALNDAGEVYAWGYSNKGQVGTGAAGTFTTVDTPTKLTGLPPVAEIGAGATASIARTSAGSLYGWGYNAAGQTGTGDGNKGSVTTPTPLAQTDDGTPWTASSLVVGGGFGIARAGSGTYYGWGDTGRGSYHTSTNQGTPWSPRPADVVNPIAPFDRLAAGNAHVLGLQPGGQVLAWGDNDFDQVGADGERQFHVAAPVVVPLPGAATDLAAGYRHSLAIVGGLVYGWGAVGQGGLGVDWPEQHIGVQTVLPAPRLSVTATSNPAGQYYRTADQTLFVNPAASGGLTVRFATAVGDPTVTGVDFPAYGAGWNGGGAGTPGGAGYDGAYTFAAGAAGGGHTVAAKNGGTTVLTSDLTVVPDGTAPVGGRIRYASATSGRSVTITVDTADDTGSGVGNVRIESRKTPLSVSGCDLAGWSDWSVEVASASTTNSRLVDGATCYQYRAVYTDRVGNSLTRTGGTLQVDGQLDFALDTIASPASGTVTVTGFARHQLHPVPAAGVTWTGPSSTSGTVCAAPTLAPGTGAFSCSWDTSALPVGSYLVQLTVNSDDSGGSTSRAVTIQKPATPPPPDPTGPSAPAAPDTLLSTTPKKKVTTSKSKAKVAFAFSSPTAGAAFECSLDGTAFRACSSGRPFKVKAGKHTFAVRAVAAGVVDATPATYAFKVKRKKRR